MAKARGGIKTSFWNQPSFLPSFLFKKTVALRIYFGLPPLLQRSLVVTCPAFLTCPVCFFSTTDEQPGSLVLQGKAPHFPTVSCRVEDEKTFVEAERLPLFSRNRPTLAHGARLAQKHHPTSGPCALPQEGPLEIRCTLI